MNPRKRALIVDDVSDWREEIKELLQDKGFAVVTASDKQAALSAVSQENFDFAIVDVNLTDEIHNVDGLLVFRYIRNNSPETAVVLISAQSLNAQELEFIHPARFIEKSNIWRELSALLD
ncbi:MAG: response regulator [Anaerolineae bacterium]|nr:response regulator [Anaerolineae bacterium]